GQVAALLQLQQLRVRHQLLDATDLLQRAVFIIHALNGQNRAGDAADVLFNIPVVESGICPGGVPAPESGFHIIVIAAQPSAYKTLPAGQSSHHRCGQPAQSDASCHLHPVAPAIGAAPPATAHAGSLALWGYCPGAGCCGHIHSGSTSGRCSRFARTTVPASLSTWQWSPDLRAGTPARGRFHARGQYVDIPARWLGCPESGSQIAKMNRVLS